MDQQPIRRTARRAGLSATTAAALAAVVAAALGAGLPPAAWAQTPMPAPNPAPPTEKPSQKNPFPKVHGDNLNRGRAHDDKYWGITDGNRSYVSSDPARALQEGQQVPFARVGSRLEMDGFQFPRLAESDPLRLTFGVDNENAGVPPVTPLTAPGVFVPGTVWQAGGPPTGLPSGVATGPSVNFFGTSYQRAEAVERPAAALDDIPAAQRAASVATWYPTVPGAANTLQRYQIRVNIPTPADSTATPPEFRITDARYVVHYHVVVNGVAQTRRRIVFLSQEGEGYRTLVDNNGRPFLFPMYSEASYGVVPGLPDTPAARARLELDNTTENDPAVTVGTVTGFRYVIADDVEFSNTSETVKATPVVTPAHGGRKVRAADNAAFVFGTGPLYQPPGETSLQRRDNTAITEDFLAVGGNVAYINDSFAFINNPRDTADPIYTDTTSNFYQPFEPWNPSTLFRGPSALVENDPGTGPVPSRTTINNANFARHPVPYFSHMQAIVARTDYVNDPADPDGITSREVGAIYGLDWLTGTPIWRFPDRTHLPANFRDQYGNLVAGAGLRNPTAALETQVVNGQAVQVSVPTIPGIGAFDKNGNRVIEDDEVFIAGQGTNPDGGISAAPTLVARMQVRGVMQVPVHSPTWNYFNDLPGAVTGANSSNVNLTSIRGIAAAAPGRYFAPGATAADEPLPVEAGVVFIAANNGVVYAIDPYGNNDNDYYQNPALPAQFGHVRAGTTNVFWTFSAKVRQRLRNETQEQYNRFLKGQIPATEAFAGSSPTISYYKEQADVNPDNTVNQPVGLDLTEPRLFVGNQNGVLYAMDARPDARAFQPVPGTWQMGEFPFRKGVQPSTTGAPVAYDLYRLDLKWWFETDGGIVSTPAVSNYRHYADNPGAPQNDPTSLPGDPTPRYILSKGVYVTTLEGRVYCVDWTGPVTKSLGLAEGHVQTVLWNGQTGDTSSASDGNIDPFTSEQLNDNFRFHNGNPATILAQADGREGVIRPRWTFPQRYRDIDADSTDNSVIPPRGAPDNSRVFTNNQLAEPRTLAPISGAPSLMDFVFDPDGPAGAAPPEMRRYVVVAANDPNGSDPEESGRLYLLDQAGDRRDFTTNPTVTTSGTPLVVVSHPLDQYSPTNYTFGKAAPTWTYRMEYKRLDPATGNEVDVQQRNSPDDDPSDGSLSPTRRLLPTVFAGGSAGRLFAVDLDPVTGYFLRWRDSEAGTRQFAVLPTPLPANYVPGPISDSERLNPMNPAIAAAGLTDRRIFARTVTLPGDGSSVDGGMLITGGPLQNRNSGVTADTVPTVPPRPANDLPILTATLLTLIEPVVQPFLPPAPPTFVNQPSFEQFGRLVNQDIDDPVATTIGAFNAFSNGAFAQTEPAVEPDTNRAYQYPTLFVTTDAGFLHQLSTNIEGESPDTSASSDGTTAALGWALTTDELRFNLPMTQIQTIIGPGGPGVGPVVVTNAYFAAMDPTYRNSVQKILAEDPSATNYQSYPPEEPVDEDPVGGDGTLDERPHFKPRPLSPGAPAAATVPEAKADAHTGRTGFPLDISGLFFDKRYAAEPGLGGENNNDDGLVRLPAYSQIGAALTPGQELVLPAGNRGLNLADPVPTNAADAIFDINPAATDAIWVFTGGSNGIFYGYTPNLIGRGSGLVGGTVQLPGWDVRRNGQPKFDIFPASYVATLQAAINAGNPIRPDPAMSLTRSNNGRPFFEWGETVYIVAYDLPWRPPVPAGSAPEFQDVITIQVRNRQNNNQVIRRTLRYPRDAQNRVVLYANESQRYFEPPVAPLDNGDPSDNPFGPNAGVYTDGAKDPLNLDNTPLTLVIMPYEIGPGGNNTPGGILEVSTDVSPVRTTFVTATGRRVRVVPSVPGGATNAQILSNLPVYFTIANPLAVQAFLSNTNDGGPANPNPNGGVSVNAIGPFAAEEASTGVKSRVVNTGIAAGGTQDPDRPGAEYSQALSNGNTVTRYIYDNFTRDGSGNPTGRNFQVGQRAKLASGQDDPSYYVPVAVSAAYIDHGTTKSSDLANNRRNLRVVNRSLMNVLPRVRVQIDGDLIWRTWPGQRPNLDPTDNGLAPGGANPRFTPTAGGGNYAMRPDGIINYLPWEQGVLDALPWKGNRRTATVTGVISATGNPSQDYPDIAARPLTGGESQDAVRVTGAGGDLVRGPGSIQASVSGGVNSTVTDGFIRDPFADATTAAMREYGVAVAITVPKFQPANLVAMHSLTSTYVAPSTLDDPSSNFSTGPIQLPRDTGTTPRLLRPQTGPGAFGGDAVVSPYGYTTRMKVYIDSNGNGIWDNAEAYREFETWMGVPVDIQLKQKDGVIALTGKGGAGLEHGFGIENGLLGYGNVLAPLPGSATFGFLPPPMPNLAGGANGYQDFFKTFSVTSESNVNLWNVRASQRISNQPDGANYFYYGMVSDSVDPRYGILAAGADPVGYNPSGLMPQVVTSLDRIFDGAWDTLSAATPQLNVPIAQGGPTRYQRFYQGFGGRHTLHKPRPGSGSSGTVLSIPDAPSAQLPGFGAGAGVPFVPQATRLGVAVPLGTPSGKYKSRIGSGNLTLFNSPFQIFEDHDTNQPYFTRPVNTGGGSIALTPAGPQYSGQALLHPGSNSILPQSGEAILRPRQVFTSTGNPPANEYLPATPNIEMEVTVGEAGLTGQVADQGLDAGGALTPSIITGTLTGIDPFPLFNAASGRPASSLTPAAFRSVATGDLHVYFSSTQANTGIRGGQPAPNTPVSLFKSSLDWDPTQGTWVAASPGTPVSATSLLASGARWFTAPAEIAGAAGNQGNRSPFVLYDPILQDPGAAGANAAATLYWVRTLPVPGGEPVNQVVYAPLDPATGQPGAPVSLLQDPSTDPTVRRYGPRAAFVPQGGTAFVFYFGGPAGRTSLYYAAQDATATGAIATRAQRERLLTVPEALSVTQEPSAVTRLMPPSVDEPAIPGRTDYVVDVYYTGISRASQNADIYVSRYRVAGSGPGARLIPIDLARQDAEELVAPGRESAYRSRHIGWFRRLTDDPATTIDDRTLLPNIYINNRTTPVTNQTAWQFDNATQLLFQRFTLGGREVVVYADTSAGELRFRGPGAPTPGGNTRVFASYTPLAYRVAYGPGADTAPIATMDRRPVLSTVNEGGAVEKILSRPADFDNSLAQGIDRQWVFWQRAASAGQPQTLYFTTRRVGVDLKALGVVPSNRSIALSQIDANRNSAPLITVSVGGNPVPYEVDVANAKVYVQGRWEGQVATIAGEHVQSVPGNQNNTPFQGQVRLQLIDEITASTDGVSGRAVPMGRRVNEGEAYPILDVYNTGPSVGLAGNAVARAAAAPGFGFPGQQDLYPNVPNDPALQPGRVWLFWSSSRGRTGTFRNPAGETISLSGYDVYWQTLAPSFQSPSFSGFPTP
ncbi:MAG TPA: hypothetical protein VM490_23340 [Armatimonadaceae bacterium]|nr:hypothetical protein [Armatimonadaceae bacterium]